MPGRIAVVDEHNRFVRWEERRTIHEQRLVHRSVHVLVFDTGGRLLIQKRHRDKQTYPGHWDGSVAGHVEESDYLTGPDETLDQVYRDVAEREVEEELGVTAAALTELAHLPPEPGIHYEHIRLYRATHDGPFTIQDTEVEDIRFVTPAEYRALVAAGAPVTHTLAWCVAWLGDRGLF